MSGSSRLGLTVEDQRSGVSLVPGPSGLISTRRHLPRTRIGKRQGIVSFDAVGKVGEDPTSLVTRRRQWRHRRRRKRLLVAIAIVLAIFPPIWAVYLVAWLVWRTRPKQKSMQRVRSAIRALKKNDTGIALRQLQEAHLLDPSNYDALYWLGLLLSEQRRDEEASEALAIVSQHVPGLPEVEAALVDAYVATDEPESAIYHAQRLFDAAPHATTSLMKLADAFEAAGRPDLAIQALEQAPVHKRTLTPGLVKIHYRLGDLYEALGDREAALAHFKRVYARDISYEDVRERVEALEAVDAAAPRPA